MTPHGVWLFTAFASALMVGSFLFSIARSSLLTATLLLEIRNTLYQLNAETLASHRTLRQQRGAINGNHKHLVVPVSKGVSKPAQ